MLKRCLFASSLLIILIFCSCSLSFEKEKVVINQNILSSLSFSRKLDSDKDLLGKVEIPKIHVEENIYSFTSDKNHVDKHVSILNGSILPNQNNSIVFLAAHSGSGKIAYFKNLDRLVDGDLVYFYYQNVVYIYQVINIFEEEKDGDIEISKSSNQQLILTTCSPNHSDKQLIVDTMLIQKKEN